MSYCIKLRPTLSSLMQLLYSVLPCQASFRLGRVPHTPQQVLPNIFAVSVLMSTSTLTHAASMPCECRVTASSHLPHVASLLRQTPPCASALQLSV
ncbi:uncharacterized protein BJ212DRAFT_583977 [Suillus subaureus]|uniref:Uncharacterized protein n=1 Tax=Suillus subaureus TaxID=48587 RepID=A0A9P7JA88_9AGAM|nr:uncharacterized protein BJ212DRAFT_583977 [Suillus subaureus]KAG1810579.1 hypothetical protein BJ212DRAFT_583977 [Suillus subaureus]